jgi:hypothetical protein
MQLSKATGVQIDISFTANVAIKDTTIPSNQCAVGYISYSKWCNSGYNYLKQLVCAQIYLLQHMLYCN